MAGTRRRLASCCWTAAGCTSPVDSAPPTAAPRSPRLTPVADGRLAGGRPTPGPTGNPEAALFRVGPAIVANLGGRRSAYRRRSWRSTWRRRRRSRSSPTWSAPCWPWRSAPEGVVVGGSFNGSGGVNRGGLASIDLDTDEVEPWTSVVPGVAVRPDRRTGHRRHVAVRAHRRHPQRQRRAVLQDRSGDRRRRRRARLPVDHHAHARGRRRDPRLDPVENHVRR